MNTEDFVTYKQALALKELGFDLKVNHYYDDEGYIIENLADYSEEVPYGEYTSYDNFNYEDFYSAPTLAQAQKWLRKNKRYSVEELYDCDDKWSYFIVRMSDGEYIRHIRDFNSSEEALSAGITECLKLLEK